MPNEGRRTALGWRSHLTKGAVRRSTFEAELYAFVHVLRMLRVARMMSEFALGYGLARTYCDNQAVVFAVRKRDLTSKSRHIRVQRAFSA